MSDSLLFRAAEIRQQLNHLLEEQPIALSSSATADSQEVIPVLKDVDVLVTHNEVNNRHGTGVLISRIFEDSTNILSIRSRNHYGGEHHFGIYSFLMSYEHLGRPQAFLQLLHTLQSVAVRRVFCVPYYSDDLLTSIAIKEAHDAELVSYIMDDQNIQIDGIPDQLMAEFLSKCTLRLTTHPEMRDAYEAKYGLKFWLLPAVVSSHLINTQIASDRPHKQGVLIGSVWSKRWFELLRETIKQSSTKLDWYGNNQTSLFDFVPEGLKADGITAHGLLPEEQLAIVLKEYAYAVVPTGILDESEDRPELGALSLPGRILFVLATSSTPILVLGSRKTPASRFVEQCGVGITSAYNAQEFQKAVLYLQNPVVQAAMRKNAAMIAATFSSENIDQWIWDSLEQGKPSDLRFENLFSQAPVPKLSF